MSIYTHIDDVVTRDKHGICEWVLLPLRVMIWRRRNMRRLAVIVVFLYTISPNLEATNDAGGWNSKQL